ncbi:MAG: S9 family peptidase [Bacteroidota bacterium]|nr:S9 family peptidase [Bacteroidota bacterium]MDX5506660.1 S9 family peptidase [Bacteroidota bacterium]
MRYSSIFLSLALAVTTTLSAQEKVMTPEMLWELGRVSLDDVSPDGKKAIYGVTYYDLQANKGNRDLYEITLKNGEVRRVTETPYGEYSAQYLMDGKAIGFSAQGHYWMMDLKTGELNQVTNIEQAGNYKAYESEDGSMKILFSKAYKAGKTTADLYPDLPKAEVKIIDDLMYRHWDHWNDEMVDHLAIATYSPTMEATAEFTDLMPREPWDVPIPPFDGSEDYVLSPDGKTVVYVAKKLIGKEWAISTNTDLYAHDLITGEATNLTFDNKGYDKSPGFSSDGQYIAWLSMERDGYESDLNRLMVMKANGGKKMLLSGDEHIGDFVWASSNTLYAVVDKEATQQIMEITFDWDKQTAKRRWVTSGNYNYGHVMVAGKELLAHRMDMNHATEIYKINIKKGKVEALTHVNDEIYGNVKMSRVEKRMVKTTDGKDMLTWVIYPPDFDPDKAYPTLLYCQGGPQSAVSQFYSFRWNFQLMAAKGYIIVAPNRRGLPGFGQEWNEAISKDWGGQAMRDYLSAIDAVAGEPYVDAQRLGAVGASYGGYSVYMLAGIHEGRFKALISHCGLFDLKSWYLTTEEMFFANFDIGGPFWGANPPKGYVDFNPINYVDNWTAPILVIHGGKDFRVPENQGMEAFNAAQLRGIPSKFLYFPNEGHWILSPQNGLIWHDQYFKWLDQWLKPE